MEIKRDLYLDMLVKRKNNGLVKVVTGLRRVGKSYLIMRIFKNHLLNEGISPDHIIEMAFDDIDNEEYLDPKVFSSFAKRKIVDGENYYFLLDEIQLMEGFEYVLNGLMRRENVDIYVTGSNAKFLSQDIITEFRGRGDEVHLWPLSFSEFMSVYAGDKRDGWNDFILYGGLPVVVLMSDVAHKVKTLKSLFDETYILDIKKRHKIRNIGEMNELLDILSSNIGSLTNPQKLMNSFKSIKKSKITSATINRYIQYLSESFLIEFAKRYDVKGKRYIETPMKYYFSDLGLRNARINFRQVEPTHSMENAIYNELRIRGFDVDVGTVPVVQKNLNGIPVHKNLEIDFVANKGSKRYYVQSSYIVPDEEKKEQEYRPFRKVDDSFKKILVTYDAPAPLYTEDGILVMSIFDFFLRPNSLDL